VLGSVAGMVAAPRRKPKKKPCVEAEKRVESRRD